MSSGSINIHPFRLGHNLDSTGHKTDLLSGSGYHVINHDDLKNSAYESLNPCRYDAHLGADDTDGCSQTSSQDSVSDLSQETLPSSPNSASSDDHTSDTHNETSTYSQWSSATQSTYHTNWHNNATNIVVSDSNTNHGCIDRRKRCLGTAHGNNGFHLPGFTNVPFRFKDGQNAKLSQDNTPVPASICPTSQQSSTPGSAILLPQGNRRRGCPTSAPACPPKLKRDTENTDAIVKMIVIFCTNLISSIWSSSAVYETSPSSLPGSNVLPLQIFITETLRRSKTSYSTLQVALYYLILLKQCLPSNQQTKASNQSGCRAMQCGRRMFLTALILASKYLQDRNYSARAWSKISGLPLKEINENERNYLGIVGWDLHVPKETFENWSKIVLAICRLSTEQDIPANGFDDQPPSPGMPPMFSRHCQLQNMCKDVAALRSWWTCNLRGLSTGIVRSFQKTEQYLLSVSPFRDDVKLPRTILDRTPRAGSPEPVQTTNTDSAYNCLPSGLFSLDRVSRSAQAIDRVDSPAATVSMPPPPMLRNLPTPQTTPRSDMTNIWNTQPLKSSLRCRASASALSSLGRSCHTLANLDMCPAPGLRLSTTFPWAADATPGPAQTPDRSLVSSPESVISDNWSFVRRSRSSSISSTSSFSTVSSSTTNSMLENDRYEKMRRDYMNVQQHLDSQSKNLQQQKRSARENIDRPRTAFRVSERSCPFRQVGRPTDLDDEGYISADYGLKKEEKEALQGLVAISAQALPQSINVRSNLQRCNTSIFQQKHEEGAKAHVLKRSRSETLDLSHESIAALYGYGKNEACPRSEIWNADLTKCTTTPCQSYATPRKPVPCGTQNKRLAVQTPNLAAEIATSHLRQDIAV